MFRRRQRAPQPITIGSVLDSRYRLQEQIGEGGAGVIYKAEDEQLKRTVAIKVLLSGGMDSGKLERFRGEARSVARLNHPNIITLYDYAEEQGQPYLVIEYIPGKDLWELDNNYAPDLMPFKEALPIVDGILAALEYSHTHHVIHRDLKPENIMITPDKQVKVMDFGLARIEGQSRLTQDGLVAGTAAYLAPELAIGEAGDHRVDLYAVGVITYELLTGRRPFSGDDPLAVISQHVHAPVVPPRHYNSAIPDDLQTIILRLLAKKPDDRYNDALEVRRELAPLLSRLQSGTFEGPAGSGQVDGLAVDTAVDSRALLKRIAQGKLVGRENVLQKLKLRWDKVRLGEYKAEPLVLISGEGGIGKTRLLRELQVYTGLRDGYILHGLAQEGDMGTPYAIFANVLSNYIAEQPVEVLRSQMSGFIAGEVVKVVPQLTEKLGAIQPNPPLEPAAERARLFEQISKFLLKVAHEQPTLLLLDDLQFADPGSLTILEMLLRQTVGTSLLVTGAYRNVGLSYSSPINRFITALEESGLTHQIPLRRLSQSAVKQLLEALLGSTVRRKFVRSIYQVTEGNPLFVEELIKSLVVDGQIVLRDNRWEQQHASLVQIPGSIRAVLGKRLDHIGSQTVELLRLASIIGRSFALDLLTEASPYEGKVVQTAIDEALGAQLIEVVQDGDQPSDSSGGEPVVDYQFQHALIRETLLAEEELRPLRRRRLHRRVAAALVKLGGDQPIKNPATLARHFIDGAQDEKAVPYLRHAGEKAHRFYANEEALDYLNQAYDILEDITPDLTGLEQEANLRERLELLSQQRDIVDMMGARDREFAILKTMQALVEASADQDQRAEVMSQFSTYYWHIGKLAEAEETAREAQKVARENRNKSGELHALEQIARVLLSRRDSRSIEYARQALALARQSDDRILEGRLKALVGQIYTNTLYDPEQAASNFERALEICRATNNRYEEAWTLWGMGGLAMLVGDYTRALRHYAAAREISEDIGSSLQAGWDLYNMGNAWYNLGDNEQALDCFRQAQGIFRIAQHPRGIIEVLISLGLNYLAIRKPDRTGSYLEQAVRRAEEREDSHLMLRCYQALSIYYRLLGGDDGLTKAVRLSNRVIKMAAEGGYFEHEIIGHFLRGVNFFERRDLQQALESSQQANVQLEKTPYISSPQISVTEIYYTHGCILTALGQVDTAQDYLRKARDETLRRANLIADERQRHYFLSNVALNQRIMAAGQELS